MTLIWALSSFPSEGLRLWEDTELYAAYAMALGRKEHAPYLSLDADGAFHPEGTVTRREVVCILYGLLDTELVGDGVFNVPGVWANNLWYDVTGRADFGGRTFAEWQACGKETGGVYADPLFVDAERFDFRLRPESPAHRMGFRGWDFSAAGRTRR